MDKERERQAVNGQLNEAGVFSESLILASASPRRAEILRAVGWPFEVAAVDIDESKRAGESPVAYVERLAREKAGAAARSFPGQLVLGADTIVLIDERVLGKPSDMIDARRMLRELSGKWHEVLTGVALVRGGEREHAVVAHESTRVRFNRMSDEEIAWHAANGKPLDKAGAYAVQGHAALFISEIQGDYWNVVGLPVQLVYKLARELGANHS
ncbi:MAG: nucleoside triphosphate pyrophosphatase [Blastocatellia bacterium]|jgi:septum formation protein|nr:nucleoside triphosphate pyrophosphatase [Blastocatellia bacterium]